MNLRRTVVSICVGLAMLVNGCESPTSPVPNLPGESSILGRWKWLVTYMPNEPPRYPDSSRAWVLWIDNDSVSFSRDSSNIQTYGYSLEQKGDTAIFVVHRSDIFPAVRSIMDFKNKPYSYDDTLIFYYEKNGRNPPFSKYHRID